MSDSSIEGVIERIRNGDRQALKDIYGKVEYGLKEIIEIDPIFYNFKREEKEAETIIGFSAQNVLKVIPEAVSKGEDGYYGLNTNGITAALVNAIKEMEEKYTSKIASLEERLEALENK